MILWTWLVLLAGLAPAPREFHQGVQYRIEATLNDSTHILTGRASLRYTNRSSNQLDTLYFHLHLNAFRPNSAWAQRELQTNQRRFQDLGPDDHAFDRVSSVVINGRRMPLVFPFAPDSTVMAVLLPRKLRPNATVVLTLDWTSRMATVPRRQGRKDRHYDWAHWYPRIAVYDTAGWQIQQLVPQGEFFGEFASYDVTLDLPQDHVIGATGVVVSGDPGWARVNRTPAKAPMMQRNAYRAVARLSLGLLNHTDAGRSRTRWRAEQVHHFAWSSDPAFVYEGDRLGDVALHALYLPGDTLWPGNVISTMKRSLAYFTSVLGPYLYPQFTATRRLDTGGTEFPMLTMLAVNPPVVHETAHEWAHAMLANNEFKEGWLDEGFATFLGNMYNEAAGTPPNLARSLTSVINAEASGTASPIATPSAQFSSFQLYQAMTYTKAGLVLRMLRWYMGDAEFARGLKVYYDQNKLQHVDENDFRAAMQKSSSRDLVWFFREWLHTNHTLDYAVTGATVSKEAERWRTQVQVTRSGDNWMPYELKVGDTVLRVENRAAQHVTVVETATRPTEVVLDPNSILIDTNPANNRRSID